tara:strand:+ start:2517 stop:2756 length:240 start_codon:yes stop_codon:yes gene_type:complete
MKILFQRTIQDLTTGIMPADRSGLGYTTDTFVKQAPVFISTHIYADYNTIGYFNVREASELTELGRTPFEIACFETTRF